MSDRDPEEEIFALIENYWKDWHRPMLYSALGGRLKPTAKATVYARAKNLSEFVQTYMAETVRHLPLTVQGGGAVPKDGTSDLSDEQLEALIPSPIGRTVAPAATPYYYPEVWKAFSTPLEENRRFLQIRPDGARLYDGAEKPEGESWKEVKQGDLPLLESEEGGVPAYRIARAVREWAEANGLTPRSLRPPQPRLTMHASGGASSQTERGIGSRALWQLESFLSSLSPAELQGFQISGPVLLSLLRRG